MNPKNIVSTIINKITKLSIITEKMYICETIALYAAWERKGFLIKLKSRWMFSQEAEAGFYNL